MASSLYPAIRRKLIAAGCNFVRMGKGSHEIWYSPVSKRGFTLPVNVTNIHTANEVLKYAGLTKAF